MNRRSTYHRSHRKRHGSILGGPSRHEQEEYGEGERMLTGGCCGCFVLLLIVGGLFSLVGALFGDDGTDDASAVNTESSVTSGGSGLGSFVSEFGVR